MKLIANHPKIESLIRGDSKVMKSLYVDLFPKVAKYVTKNSGNYDDAKEIFQDALFQLITRAKLKGIAIKGSFEGYIFTVCKNLWLKEIKNRKKKVRYDGVIELTSKDDQFVDAIVEQERWDIFEESIALLGEHCKEILKAYFNKMPYSEIVIKFACATENAAFQRVYKCKSKLMKMVRADVRYNKL